MKKSLFGILLLAGIAASAQNVPTVKIGTQTWMAKNLESQQFQDGTPIRQAQDAEAWQNATANGQPAWAWYYDEAIGRQYGYLYNIHAITKGNPCPSGFRVPTKADWETLFSTVNNATDAVKSTSGWKNGGGSNSSGMNILAGGIRSGYGGFNDYQNAANIWGTTPHETDGYGLYALFISPYAETLKLNPSGERGGLNCRCIKE